MELQMAKVAKQTDEPAGTISSASSAVAQLRALLKRPPRPREQLTAEQRRLLDLVESIKPIRIEGNSTEFIRAERNRTGIAGRNEPETSS